MDSKLLPPSDTAEAWTLIERVLKERGNPLSPSAAARAGYEAALRAAKVSSTSPGG